jgi:hypothetical protein
LNPAGRWGIKKVKKVSPGTDNTGATGTNVNDLKLLLVS